MCQNCIIKAAPIIVAALLGNQNGANATTRNIGVLLRAAATLPVEPTDEQADAAAELIGSQLEMIGVANLADALSAMSYIEGGLERLNGLVVSGLRDMASKGNPAAISFFEENAAKFTKPGSPPSFEEFLLALAGGSLPAIDPRAAH